MNQLLLPQDYTGAPTVRITGRDHHYLRNVLRVGPGDTLNGRDRSGTIYKLTVAKEEGNALLLRSERQEEPESSFDHALTLFQCLPKAAKMDDIVRRATEMGAMRIVPLISECTVSRPSDAKRSRQRTERWRRITKEALQQSGAPRLPIVEEPSPLERIERRERGCDLFFHVDRTGGWSLHRLLRRSPRTVNLLVGPEGGFSKREIEFILHCGFSPVCLGDTILRVETAAVAAISAVRTLLWERDDWTTA